MPRLALVLSGALLLAGCGERRAEPLVVAALGDSITAGSPAYDPDPSQRARFGFRSNEQSQWEHWAHRRDRALSFRNCGVFGERTDEIAERLARCAKGADVLVVQGGINDIVQGRGVDAAAANLRAMVRHGRRLGLRVALVDVLPWNNAFPAAREQIRTLNAGIAEIAASEHVPLLPFNATLADPRRSDRMRPDWTSDGNHPSVSGYRRLGELAFRLPPG